MTDAATPGFIALALPFLAAALAPFAGRAGAAGGWLLALLPAAAFALLLTALGAVADGAVLSFGVDWVPSLGIALSFRLDGLSLVFALLVTGVGALILVYSAAYLTSRAGRFLAVIAVFMGAMLGLVLADDLVTLVVFWELTSVASFLLIGFDHEREAARRGAVQALAITGLGGLALLAAALWLRAAYGIESLGALLAGGEAGFSPAAAPGLLVLFLIAAFTKSAQVPFHVWLPNAMEAPTPVSAYLHSATMVKAGVYLLLRLHPVFGDAPLWQDALPLFGGATLLLGAVMALRQSDVKLVLAYTTLASLGLITLLIGIGAVEAAVLYLLAHALFKGGLFMVAGAIDHGAGTRDLRALGGLGRAMPLTFAAALLGALSMAGVTPFLGFLAKEALYARTLPAGWAIALAAFAGNALMAAAAAVVALKPFLGRRPEGLAQAHEAGAGLLVGPLALGLAGLAAGLLSGPFHALATQPMAGAALGRPAAVAVSAVPHLDAAFALSLATLALGAAVYAAADPLRRALARLEDRIGWGPDRGFDQLYAGLIRGAVAATRLVQSGRLDRYTATVFAALALVLLAPLVLGGAMPRLPDWPSLRIEEALAALLLLAGLLAVVLARSRLTAIVSLGVQGTAVAILFLILGAPDLAFTQFMVETLSVVILALVMTRLSLDVADRRPVGARLLGGALALACGGGLALLLLAVTQDPLDPQLSEFYAQASYVLAHGRNVVNVVIVDFRGLDTMGEIAVVMTTGLAILALLRLKVGELWR